MEPAENAEKVSTLGRRKGNSRIPEQEREHRAERGPEDEQREDRRDTGAVDLLHEDRHDEIRLGVCGSRDELTPWHDADDREIDPEIDDRDGRGADEDR